MFKIKLQNSEFYKSKSGRVQHYKSNEKAVAKIDKLGEIGAIVVECKPRKLEKIATDTKNKKMQDKDFSRVETDAFRASSLIILTKEKGEKRAFPAGTSTTRFAVASWHAITQSFPAKNHT